MLFQSGLYHVVHTVRSQCGTCYSLYDKFLSEVSFLTFLQYTEGYVAVCIENLLVLECILETLIVLDASTQTCSL